MGEVGWRLDQTRLAALLTNACVAGDPAAWEAYLCAFHESVLPGRFAQAFVDAHGKTSYDLLLERLLMDISGGALLDVGCGDGAFARALQSALPASRITGIDICAPLLERAREIDPQGPISYIEGSALALPFANNSFNALVSHLTLMLLPRIETALAEMRRVLRDRGHAYFVVDLSEQSAGTFGAMRSAGLDFLRESYVGFIEPKLGDGRAKEPEALKQLLVGAGFHSTIEMRDTELVANGSPEEGWELFTEMYVFGSLDEQREAQLKELITALLRSRQGPDGSVRLLVPLRMIVAHA